MRPATRRLQSIAGIVLATLLFVAVVLLSDRVLHGQRLDLTENSLYSITDATQRVLDDLDEPVTLTLYFSYEAAEGVPYVREYARRVRELLQSYAARSDGRIRLERVDPKPLTGARERADELGLEPVPAGDGKQIYLGLVGTNAYDDVEVIEFFEPERERFLEYDISRLVWSLDHPDPPRVGILTSLPMFERIDPGSGRQFPNWSVIDRLEAIVDLVELDAPLDTIDQDLDALMVVHPRRRDAGTRYAIDQYLMRGGRVLMFVDPVAGSDSGRRPTGDGGIETRISRSRPGPLLAGWGIDVDLDRALADPRSGMVVSAGEESQRDIHPGLMRVEADGLVDNDPITALIDQVIVASPGSIGVVEDGPQLVPLMRSAESAAPVPAAQFVGFETPWEIVRGFRPDERRHILAGRIRGRIPSAYPGGPPADAEVDADAHREITEDGRMVLFADTDLLTDRLWVRRQPTRGGGMSRAPFAGNGDLVANAAENLVGSDALLALRARGTSARPFTRVRELEREAMARYRDERRELRDQLEQVEARIESLRAGDGEEDGAAILSDEQRVELARARERRTELRAELRTVEQRLDAEIDALGRRLKVLNIAVVPLFIAAAAVGVFTVRRRRRRRRAG